MTRTEQDRRRRQMNRRIREVMAVRRSLAAGPPPRPESGPVDTAEDADG